MLGDGYDVCWKLWNQHAAGTQVAAGLVRDYPQLTNDQAAHFVLAAYNDLCPVPGSYDYWAYSTRFGRSGTVAAEDTTDRGRCVACTITC